MPVFRDTEHLYQVLGALFQRVETEQVIVSRLLEGNLVVRFRFTDPEGTATIDLRRAPIRYTFGPSDLEPDVEMIQSGDTAHQFWLGRLNVARAIATRKVISRGSASKALALLPAIKPVYDLYPEVLRNLGYESMIPEERGENRERRTEKGERRIASGERSVGKKGGWLARLFGAERAGEPRMPPEADDEALNRHFIPLVEGVVADKPPEVRAQTLPSDEGPLKVEMLRRMRLIRAFEEALSEANARGEVPTEAIHLSIGQEATAVGVCFALQPDDYMTTTHRGHGHMLAKGADVRGMMAEIFAKDTGLCKGKGGTMHVTEAAVGALGANGIVGAPYLIATGAALSARQRASGQVAAAIAGDGATNQGMFHEALNFAAVFKLPVLFVIENNLYGEFTPVSQHASVQRLSDRAAAYGMPGVTVDGNDVWAVYKASQEAVARAREGQGPTLLECLTYRWHGHMEGEEERYRDRAEVEAWRARDPIQRLEQELLASRILTAEQVAKIGREAEGIICQAMAFARESPEPPLQALTEDIFAPEPAQLYRPAPPQATTREISYARALFEALAEEMGRDERVFLLGEDVSTGGYFSVTVDLVDEFGSQRVIDTPISEYAIVGAAVGAAMTGLRPVAEILFSDFLTTCMDPIVNQAAKLRYMSGGQYALPLVVRTPGGGGLGMGAQHSQSLEALLTGIPGLIVIAPGTPYDAKGLLKAAIRSNNPVLFFEDKLLYTAIGPVPPEDTDYVVPIGVAEVKRPGDDVTLVAIGAMVGRALEAAEELSCEDIEAEVVDLRTLVPCDWATVVRSVVKTGRLIVAEPGALTHGFGAEVVARVSEVAMGALKAPPRRVAAADVPLPYNRALENAALPDADDILKAARELFA
jgi:2-oxoisovalerate dehydrogenase E1 component